MIVALDVAEAAVKYLDARAHVERVLNHPSSVIGSIEAAESEAYASEARAEAALLDVTAQYKQDHGAA